MRFLRSNNWIRLRNQIEYLTGKVCKMDMVVNDQERVFFIAETDEEKEYMKYDELLYLTGVPVGPVSIDPEGEWGWRMLPDATEQQMEEFAKYVSDGITAFRAGYASVAKDKYVQPSADIIPPKSKGKIVLN